MPDGSGKQPLEAAKQHAQSFEEKLEEYVDFVEQAKGGG